MVEPASEDLHTDALIIGAGPIGLFQAFQLGLQNIACHIVDALPHPGGQCVELYGDKPIYDIPGTPVTTGRALVASLLQQVAPLRPTLHLGEQVTTLARQGDGRLRLGTTAGQTFVARTVFIAAGVGAFVPRRLALAEAAQYEGTRLHYHPESLDAFANQTVVVNGGDDAALRTAIALTHLACQVTLVHRRDGFQADAALVAELRALVAAGRMDFVTGQPSGLDATHVHIRLPDESSRALPADALVACLGISPRLGPIADWGLALERKQLPVDTEKFQTAEPGIFAVGDINTYPGKKKLILCGFHEATLAAWAASQLLFPAQQTPLEYTTSSRRLQRLLGVEPPTT
jgi:thioredoxin reductase (NADPH)